MPDTISLSCVLLGSVAIKCLRRPVWQSGQRPTPAFRLITLLGYFTPSCTLNVMNVSGRVSRHDDPAALSLQFQGHLVNYEARKIIRPLDLLLIARHSKVDIRLTAIRSADET